MSFDSLKTAQLWASDEALMDHRKYRHVCLKVAGGVLVDA